MIVFFIVLSIFLINSVLIITKKDKNTTNKLFYFSKKFSLLTLKMFLLYISLLIVVFSIDVKYVREYKDLPIQSVFNEGTYSTQGSFILGTGGFNGGTYKEYIVQGVYSQGMQILSLPVKDYYVREDSLKEPCIEDCYSRIVFLPYKSKWGLDFDSEVATEWNINYKTGKILVVPVGTVKKEYIIK